MQDLVLISLGKAWIHLSLQLLGKQGSFNFCVVTAPGEENSEFKPAAVRFKNDLVSSYSWWWRGWLDMLSASGLTAASEMESINKLWMR